MYTGARIPILLSASIKVPRNPGKEVRGGKSLGSLYPLNLSQILAGSVHNMYD